MVKAQGNKLKGGHPPAVKAGERRITQHKISKDGGRVSKLASSKSIFSLPNSVLVRNTLFKGLPDHTEEAVQHTREKPLPSRNIRTAHISHLRMIQQPRKQ